MKKIIISIIIVAAIVLVVRFVILPEPIPTPTSEPVSFTLSINVEPSEAGSISPASGKYEEGTTVTLTATPDSGYTFDYWHGDASGSSASVIITMDSDKSITAYFSVVDTTPPIISGVEVSDITETSAIITWTTDKPATSQVELGQSISYGSITALDERLVTDHRVRIELGIPLASWHFRVISLDKTGNEAVSEDFFFRTALPPYLPITHNIKFTAVDEANVSWTSGTITAAEGSQFSVNAGSLRLENDNTYYLYYQLNDPVLKYTQTFGNAVSAERILIAFVQMAVPKALITRA